MGDKVLLDKASFIVQPGAIVGIIGPNGAGKSTLFKMLVGQEQPDGGTLKIGETVQFAYVDQGRDSLTPGKSVYDIISEGHDLIKLGGREVNARAYCSRFNFLGADQQKKVDVLSGGERNRLHLACMLKSGANVLLLDEPTNDIDVNTMRALEDALENFAGACLSSATIVGSWIELQPIFLLLRMKGPSALWKAITATMKKTDGNASAKKLISRTE